MNLNWFLSRTSRQASQMRKHVWKILSAQRDLLSPKAIESVGAALARVDKTVAATTDRKKLREEMANLEEVANKWLKPYPNAGFRENVEVLLVAIAVAMGIRTFFLQPFKIPTGSMQPTLFGITSNPDFSKSGGFHEELRPRPDFQIPNPFSRFFQFWFAGVGYDHVVAKEDGALRWVKPPQRFLLFNLWQTFQVGDHTYRVWFPADDLLARAGLTSPARGGTYPYLNPKVFHAGEDVLKIKTVSGDHLFVDRLTYNFRTPERGEIIVFATAGTRIQHQDQFYIKRLVALGGETVRIGDDRHLVIDGKRLDSSTPHFDNVYGFDPNRPPEDSKYSGHLNGTTGLRFRRLQLAPLFPDENATVTVSPDGYLAMGDNTVNSADSRVWGEVPKENVIGKACFVYWPFGSQNGRKSRFGWGVH